MKIENGFANGLLAAYRPEQTNQAKQFSGNADQSTFSQADAVQLSAESLVQFDAQSPLATDAVPPDDPLTGRPGSGGSGGAG
ncbi:hypothetical protein [Acanthopleuribacter pedis]|uniref:Uncharacterized protein n=1 Tax=Acanthopleuribacter pedis TaxID=442870 RepID=A0A8J7U512_9BACT|nr:hypothetical protein [Acanthopleuribacter pedis]MBO1320354.1 hypothetical protein [Acanthopleuribacter pedis]